MKNKKLLIALALTLLVLLSYNSASAATVYEDVGIIVGADADFRSFVADVAPFRYLLTLMDLSPEPELGFNFLGLVLLDSNAAQIGFLSGPGEFTFDAVANQKYYVNVFGEGAGEFDAGVYGVRVSAVPIPGAALLMGSGLFLLALVRRRKH